MAVDRKHGRNAKWCKAYRDADKHILSHLRRAWKHVQRYGATDHMAVHYLNNASLLLKRRLGIPEKISPEKTAHKRIEPDRPMPSGRGAMPTQSMVSKQ